MESFHNNAHEFLHSKRLTIMLVLALCARTTVSFSPRSHQRFFSLKLSSGGSDPIDCQCPCGSGNMFSSCCEPVLSDINFQQGAIPLLRARYTANVKYKEHIDFVIKTTHPSHEDYNPDTDQWRRSLVDFCRCCTFESFDIESHTVVDEDLEKVTWSARIKVFDGQIRDDLVQTKEFRERSKFIKDEEGRWWYAGGDEDFVPSNIIVEGPMSPDDRAKRLFEQLKNRRAAKKSKSKQSRSPLRR